MDKRTKPLGARERELLAMPPLASQMPIILSKKVRWLELKGQCKLCHQEIPDGLMRGQVARPLSNMATVEAMGVCPHCRVATSFLYRLYDDMRVTSPRNGRWMTWRPERTFLERLKLWWIGAFGANRHP